MMSQTPAIHYISSHGIGQPWVANELRIVTRSIPVRLHAMREPQHAYFDSVWAKRMAEDTRVLYPIGPVRLITSFFAAPLLFGRRFWSAITNALFGERENIRARIAGVFHFMVACVWARALRSENVSHIHSQWAYSSGTIGMYGAWLLGVSFSFTGHATDLFRDRCALKDKIRRAQFIACISTFHRDFFLEHGASPDKLRIVYCGIDPKQFDYREHGFDGTLRIRSSGRLVEKKGFSDLIRACGALHERGVAFDCEIAGSGPLEADLRRQIEEAGLADRVRVTGEPLKQEDIPSFMHGGDVYCLPCVWASDNDVDGLPQMLMEAMACGLPVVSTRLVGIPDLVKHEQTGLLVEPNRPDELADALQRLGGDADLRSKLARDGRAWVEEAFDINSSLEPLIDAFRGFEAGRGVSGADAATEADRRAHTEAAA